MNFYNNNFISSREVTEQLRRINSSQAVNASVIPFIGAGASTILGLPDWKELVQNYADKVGFTENLDTLFLKYFRSWPKVADDIFGFANGDLEGYVEYMAGIKPRNASFHALHIKIVKTFKKLITTNYDRAFEGAYLESFGSSPSILYFPDTLNPAQFHDKTFAYIHGHVEHKRFVFRQQEYVSAYVTLPRIKDFLKSVIQSNHLLFIGFSFDDEIFRENLRSILNELHQEKEEVIKTFGQPTDKIENCRLFCILSMKDTETTIKKAVLTEVGLSEDMISKYFVLLENESCEVIINQDLNIEEQITDSNFLKEYNDKKFNMVRLTYMKTLDFQIITFDDNSYIQIEDIIKNISQQEPQFLDGIPKI